MSDTAAVFSPATVPQTLAPRPLLIDENDGKCDICAAWVKNKEVVNAAGKTLYYNCDECGQQIQPFNPVVDPRGCTGVKPHHYHLRGVGPASMPGKAGIYQELCLPCYITHRQKIYPQESAQLIETKCKNH